MRELKLLAVVLPLFICHFVLAQVLVSSSPNSLSIKNNDILKRYLNEQQEDGGFRVPIRTSSIIYNTQTLFMYAYLGVREQKADRIRGLFEHIWSNQNEDGSFSAYPGDGGSPDVSLMVYLTAKLLKENTPELSKLEKSLLSSKKLRTPGNLSLPYLMLAGVDRRSNCLIPMGLPQLFKQDQRLPWVRVLMYPLLYLYDTRGLIEVDDYNVGRKVGCPYLGLRKNLSFRKEGEAMASWLEKYTDDIGMVFSYVPTTIPWVMALYQLKKKSPKIFERIKGSERIEHAISSIESYQVKSSIGLYQSPGEGSVAETVEVGMLFLDAGLSATHPLIQNAVSYLLSIQQESGGLGFSKHNRHFPDPDDTGLVLSFWQRVFKETRDNKLKRAIDSATQFIISRANSDGGFGDWVREQDLAWWFRPLAKNLRKSGLVVSESAIDATARVLIGLSTQIDQSKEAQTKWQNGIEWLLSVQRPDGSFLSTWMVGFGFGTTTALGALGTAIDQPAVDQVRLRKSIQGAIEFLMQLQKLDGSFSEDLSTYIHDRPIISEYSSPAMTGIVLNRLLMFLESAPEYSEKLSTMIKSAYSYLANSLDDSARAHDLTWTAVSFPKIEYARYEIIQDVEIYRSLVLYEKFYTLMPHSSHSQNRPFTTPGTRPIILYKNSHSKGTL